MNLDVILSLEGERVPASDLGELVSRAKFSFLNRLLDGTSAGQIDRWFKDTRTLAASANEDLDLAGSLVDEFGATITFARIKLLLVRAAAGNTNNVNVTRPSSNGVPWALAAGDGVAVAPGEAKLLVCRYDATGILVSGGSGDLINVANSAGGSSVTYDVFIAGCSA